MKHWIFIYVNIEDDIYSVRVWRWFVRIKGPKALALFSERHGYDKPKFTLKGWRLFAGRLRVR